MSSTTALQARLLELVRGRTGAKGGFIDRYVRWACGQTDAPPNAHVLSALMGVATVMHPKASVQYGTYRLDPNLFALNVGSSGRVRKTWSMSMVRRMLERVAPTRIGMTSGSYEAMIDELKDRPYCTVFESEFTTVLSGSGTGTGGPGEKLKTGITNLYDGGKVSNRTRKNGQVLVSKYRLNILGAISPSYLCENTSPEDYTGGFLSRWLFAFGERPPGQFLGVFDVVPNPTEEAEVEAALARLAQSAPPGVWMFRPEAIERFRPWELEIEGQSNVVQERFQGFLNRASGLAVRIAALVATDRLVNVEGYEYVPDQGDILGLNRSQEQTWEITVDDFDVAAEIVRCHMEDVKRITETIEHTKEAKVKARILNATPLTGWVPMSHLTEGAGMTLKTIRDPLDTLVAEGRIQRVERAGGTAVYRRSVAALTDETVDATPIALPGLPIGHHVAAPLVDISTMLGKASPASPAKVSPTPAPARSYAGDAPDEWEPAGTPPRTYEDD